MKPIRLTIEGIKSFTDAQTVDFSVLGQSNIFCISGVTGSGKTTIYDSIILALYGSSEKGVLKDFINLGTEEASVEFVFGQTGEGGWREYRIYRVFNRKGTKKTELDDLTTGKRIADKSDEATAFLTGIIGLGRSDFTQVVILEQGKFNKFLTAGPTDRINTVSKLFKLHKYEDLIKKVNVRYDEVQNEKTLNEQVIKENADVTEEGIRSLKEKTDELLLQKTELEGKLTSVQAVIEKLGQDRDKSLKYLSDAESLKQALNKRDILTKTIEKCAEKKENLALNQADAAQAKKALALLDEKAGRIRTFEVKAEELKKINGSLESLREEYRETGLKLIKAEEDQSLLSAAILGDRQTLSEALCLAGVEEDSDLARLQSRLINLKTDLKSAYERLKMAQENLSERQAQWKVKQNAAIGDSAKVTELLTQINRRKQKVEDIKALIEEAEHRLVALRIADSAAAVAAKLSVGDECPVCGHTVEKILQGQVVGLTETEEEISCLKKQLRQAEDAVIDAEKTNAAYGRSYEKNVSDAEELKKGIEELTGEIAKTSACFARPPEEMLTALTRAYEGSANLVKSQNSLSALLPATENLRYRRQAVEKEGNEKKQRRQDLANEIFEFTGDIPLEKLGQSIAVEMAERKKTAEEFDAAWTAVIEEEQKLSSELAALCERISVYQAATSDVPIYDEAAYRLAQKDKDAYSEQKDKVAYALGAANQSLNRMTENIERIVNMRKEIKIYDMTLKNLEIIKKVVKNNNFLNYIAEEYISAFTAAASSRLSSLSQGKFSLVYEDKNFMVKDFLRGNELRGVNTLSGGEMFLASLSMAIAVSQNIARYRNFEFFFLDEGFGTLDSDTIETVASSLKSLSKEVMVGLVTHRNELVDRINDKLIVTPATDSEGSKVTVVCG